MFVLVTGDRDWDDRQGMEWALRQYPITELVHGDCRGADKIAGHTARVKIGGIKVYARPADWERYGKGAGPVRNREMLEEFPQVEHILAFHNNIAQSKGTKDMMEVGAKAGKRVTLWTSAKIQTAMKGAQTMDPREARKQAFINRHQKSKQVSEGMGLGFFRGDLQGVNFWKCGEGDHDLDIIPYIAGPNDPDTPEGQWTYVLEVYEHRDVGGIEGQNYICLMKTYGRPCPICEHRMQLIKEGADDDLIKELRPSRYPRSIYNVLVYDSQKEEEKGVQVFHTSHYLMQQHLDKLSESSRRDIEQGHPPYKFFADQDEGYSVRFNRTGQGLNTRFMAHQLVQRNYQIPQATLDQAFVLDDLIYIPTYEEVFQAYWGEPMPDAAGTAAPAVTSPRGGRGGASTSTAPAPAAADPRGYVPPPAEEQQYDQQAYTGEVYECPGGGTFGVDAYELAYCEQCPVWESCVAASGQGGDQTTYDNQPAPAPVPEPTPAPAPAPTAGGRAPAPVGRGGPPAPGRAASPATGGTGIERQAPPPRPAPAPAVGGPGGRGGAPVPAPAAGGRGPIPAPGGRGGAAPAGRGPAPAPGGVGERGTIPGPAPGGRRVVR